MNDLYTRSGRLLQRFGTNLHARSGRYLGQLSGGKVFDPAGRYCGTVIGDRVVYRTIDSAAVSPVSAAENCPATSGANRTGTSLWGKEPPFLD